MIITNIIIRSRNRTEIGLAWVKGHAGIDGNEIADKAANLGHKQDRSAWFKLDQEERINMIKTKLKGKWIDNWNYTIDSGKGQHLRHNWKIQRFPPSPHKQKNLAITFPSCFRTLRTQ